MSHTKTKLSGLSALALGFAFLVPGASGLAQEARDNLPRFFVAADPARIEMVSQSKRKEILDTVEDLRKQLEKRKRLRVVSDEEDATLKVYILDRRIEMRQQRSDYGGGHVQQQYTSRHLIAYRLEQRGSSQDGEHYLVGSLVTWRRVAGDLAKSLERFAMEERGW